MENLNQTVDSFMFDDLDFEILPGGANEPVVHVPAIIVAGVILIYASPAY